MRAWLAALCIACSGEPSTPAEQTGRSEVAQRVLLGFGYSNMVGPNGSAALAQGSRIRGFDLDGTWTTNPTRLNSGSPTVVPLFPLWTNGAPQRALMLYVAEALAGTISKDDTIAVVSTAQNGSNIADWAVNSATTELYGATRAVLGEMFLDPDTKTVDAVCIYLGATDGDTEEKATTAGARLGAIIAGLRAEYWFGPRRPVYVIVPPVTVPADPAPWGAFWEPMRSSLYTLNDPPNRVYTIDAPPVTSNADKLHHDEAELRVIASRIAAVQSLLYLGGNPIRQMTNDTTAAPVLKERYADR
jgi:hypothetical protein